MRCFMSILHITMYDTITDTLGFGFNNQINGKISGWIFNKNRNHHDENVPFLELNCFVIRYEDGKWNCWLSDVLILWLKQKPDSQMWKHNQRFIRVDVNARRTGSDPCLRKVSALIRPSELHSPLWIRRCSFRWCLYLKAFPHSLHLNLRFPVPSASSGGCREKNRFEVMEEEWESLQRGSTS